MTSRKRLPLCIIALLLAALACSPFSWSPAATIAPAEDPVAAPTQPTSPPASPEPSAMPVQLPAGSDAGFLIFATDPGFYPGVSSWWAIDNRDLSLRPIAQDVINPHDVAVAISPDGVHLAFITQDSSRSFWGHPALQVFDVATWQAMFTFPLENEAMRAEGEFGMESDTFDTFRTILELDSVAWSHAGHSLSFNAGTYGTSGDVYVLDLPELAVAQLTDGPTHSIHLAWTPDDRAILHLAVETLGTGAGYAVDRIWAAPADGGTSVDLGRGSDMSGDEQWLGWLDARTAVVHSWNAGCGQSNFRLLNVESGAESLIYEGCFTSVAFNQDQDQLLYAAPSGDFLAESGAPGTWLYTIATGYSLLVEEESALEVFYALGEGAFYLVDDAGAVSRVMPDGSVTPLANPEPVMLSGLSDTGIIAWRLKSDFSTGPQPGLFISQPGGAVIRIADLIPRVSVFSPGGDRLFVLTDEGIYMGEAPGYGMSLLYSAADIGAPPAQAAWLGG